VSVRGRGKESQQRRTAQDSDREIRNMRGGLSTASLQADLTVCTQRERERGREGERDGA
jgi:hypothetical protein